MSNDEMNERAPRFMLELKLAPLAPVAIQLPDQPDIPLIDIVVCANHTQGRQMGRLMDATRLLG
jgi:hypothetical protein